MLAISPPEVPDDFEPFWRSSFDRAVVVPTHTAYRRVPDGGTDDTDLYEIEFDALGLNGHRSQRIGGWFTVPRAGPVDRAEIIGHGYGGRGSPDLTRGHPPAVRLFPCARGFHRSQSQAVPSIAADHVLHGIASRDTYIHLGCCADLWAATSALLELFPEVADLIYYSGGSFGGGIGALALPWDHRVRRVHLDVPSFGNHSLRLGIECMGSGEAVRLYHQQEEDVLPVLQYFDAASAASFMDKPTLVSCARFDPAVPPPGQLSVYNAIKCEKRLVLRDGGHFEYEGLSRDEAVLGEAVSQWFHSDLER